MHLTLVNEWHTPAEWRHSAFLSIDAEKQRVNATDDAKIQYSGRPFGRRARRSQLFARRRQIRGRRPHAHAVPVKNTLPLLRQKIEDIRRQCTMQAFWRQMAQRLLVWMWKQTMAFWIEQHSCVVRRSLKLFHENHVTVYWKLYVIHTLTLTVVWRSRHLAFDVVKIYINTWRLSAVMGILCLPITC